MRMMSGCITCIHHKEIDEVPGEEPLHYCRVTYGYPGIIRMAIGCIKYYIPKEVPNETDNSRK